MNIFSRYWGGQYGRREKDFSPIWPNYQKSFLKSNWNLLNNIPQSFKTCVASNAKLVPSGSGQPSVAVTEHREKTWNANSCIQADIGLLTRTENLHGLFQLI